MILSNRNATIDSLRAENTFLRKTVLGLVILMVCGVMAGLALAPRHRTILTPPVIHKSFWVEDDRVSAEYLEEMGWFIARSYLDLTPDSIDFNLRQLLRYASPNLHGPLEKEMLAARERLRSSNATQDAVFQEFRSDPVHSRVAIFGTLKTRIAGREMPPERKVWLIEFSYGQGRVQLINIRETSSDDPFGEKPPAAIRPRPGA